MEQLAAKNPGQPEFLQAVQEVAESVMPTIESTPAYRKAKSLDRPVMPISPTTRTHRKGQTRNRASAELLRHVDARRTRGSSGTGLPHQDEHRDRPVQRQSAVPSYRQSRPVEVLVELVVLADFAVCSFTSNPMAPTVGWVLLGIVAMCVSKGTAIQLTKGILSRGIDRGN
jgi:hypothetical protein